MKPPPESGSVLLSVEPQPLYIFSGRSPVLVKASIYVEVTACVIYCFRLTRRSFWISRYTELDNSVFKGWPRDARTGIEESVEVDAKQLFFERYEGFREYPQHLVNCLTETQLRQSPHAALNPISWTLWHIARSEDIGVNRLLVDRPQVFDECEWSSRLRVSRRDFGTGMSKAEVAQLSESINLAELDSYRAAVGNRTVSMVAALPLAELADTLSQKWLRQVFADEEAGGTLAEEIVEAYEGHTKGWLLGHLVLTHSFYHIGQAFGVRALLGEANPW